MPSYCAGSSEVDHLEYANGGPWRARDIKADRERAHRRTARSLGRFARNGRAGFGRNAVFGLSRAEDRSTAAALMNSARSTVSSKKPQSPMKRENKAELPPNKRFPFPSRSVRFRSSMKSPPAEWGPFILPGSRRRIAWWR